MAISSLWTGSEPLVLASGSAVRRQILAAAGIPVEIAVSGIDERAVEARLPEGLPPLDIATALARAKALAVSARRPGLYVLGADQVLSLAGELFTKPADPAAAREQIARLAGRSHTLHSGAILARDGRVLASVGDEARLTMRALGADAIARYAAAAGEAATRSVGAYEIEGLGLHLFERVEGAHETILGLPLLPLLAEFRRLGLLSL